MLWPLRVDLLWTNDIRGYERILLLLLLIYGYKISKFILSNGCIAWDSLITFYVCSYYYYYILNRIYKCVFITISCVILLCHCSFCCLLLCVLPTYYLTLSYTQILSFSICYDFIMPTLGVDTHTYNFKYQQLIDTLYNTLKFALVPVKFHTHSNMCVWCCLRRFGRLFSPLRHSMQSILVADVINTIRILLWFCRVHRYYAVTIMSMYISTAFFFLFFRPLLVCECVLLLSFLQQFYLIIIPMVLYACFMNQYTENGHGHYYFYYFGCYFFFLYCFHSFTHWLSRFVCYLVGVIVCCAVIRTLFILFVCLLASMWLLRSCRNAK